MVGGPVEFGPSPFFQATGSGIDVVAITAGPVMRKKERSMRSQWAEMDPVDDVVTQQTPGLRIYQKIWGDMQCAYHIFAPGTDFTQLLKGLPDDLCGVPHHAYIISGSMKVIYKDGSVDFCKAGDVCYWPAPHNFISDEGAELIQFSTCGALAAQAKIIEDMIAKMKK
jgi:mannose-6-phosphate isomerase-like protein (cupin superfamily)